MELPTDVLIHNELVNMKGSKGILLAITPHGYYELNVKFGDRLHRVFLPIDRTVLISQDPEETGLEGEFEIER